MSKQEFLKEFKDNARGFIHIKTKDVYFWTAYATHWDISKKLKLFKQEDIYDENKNITFEIRNGRMFVEADTFNGYGTSSMSKKDKKELRRYEKVLDKGLRL